jgi:hypothetical protein
MTERANNMKRKGDVSSDAGQSDGEGPNLVRGQIQAKKKVSRIFLIILNNQIHQCYCVDMVFFIRKINLSHILIFFSKFLILDQSLDR